MPHLSKHALAVILGLVAGPAGGLRRRSGEAVMTLKNTVDMLPKLVQLPDFSATALHLLDLAIENFAATEAPDVRPPDMSPPPPGLLALLQDPDLRAATEQAGRDLTKHLRAPGEEPHIRRWAEKHFGRVKDKASLAKEPPEQIAAAVKSGGGQIAAAIKSGCEVIGDIAACANIGTQEDFNPIYVGVYGSIAGYVHDRSLDGGLRGWAIHFSFEPTWSYNYKSKKKEVFQMPLVLEIEVPKFILAIQTDFQEHWVTSPTPDKLRPKYVVYTLTWYRNTIGPNSCELCRLRYGGGAFVETTNFTTTTDVLWNGKGMGLAFWDVIFGSQMRHAVDKDTSWFGPLAWFRARPKQARPSDHFLGLGWYIFVDLDPDDEVGAESIGVHR